MDETTAEEYLDDAEQFFCKDLISWQLLLVSGLPVLSCRGKKRHDQVLSCLPWSHQKSFVLLWAFSTVVSSHDYSGTIFNLSCLVQPPDLVSPKDI